jgi:hypothetical protein
MPSSVIAGPRPWFISLTAIWHEATGFEALHSAVVASLESRPLPGHQLLLPRSVWHSTAFAILQITGKENSHQTGSDHAAGFLRAIGTQAIVDQIRAAFQPFTVTVSDRKCFDDSTTVQFNNSTDIEGFRRSVQPILTEHLKGILSSTNHGVTLDSLVTDRHKSQGNRFFGSIARSPFPLDTSFYRWQEPLAPVSLTFNSIHLLVSDDALTNPRSVDVTDIPISSQ